jgi:hypothetical protein
MQRPAVFKPRVPVAAYALLGIVVLLGAFSNLRSVLAGRGGAMDLGLAVAYGLLGVWLALAFGLRHRPVVEIHGTQLRYGPSYWPGRSVVDLDEVEEVQPVTGWRHVLTLRLRSGRAARVPLRELRPEEREEVVRVVRERSPAGRADG